MRKTPLYEIHCKLKGKIIDFGGWALPVQYSDILEEHQRVRTAAGLFDVSHMGEITVRGPDAAGFIQKMATNDISAQKDCLVIYSLMCYPGGGVVDDLLIYKFGSDHYLLVVNAANTEKDFKWLQDHIEGDVEVSDVSGEYAQLALQGPKAEAILQKLAETRLAEIKFYHFLQYVDLGGIKTLVSRTGYTGEDGFELYITPQDAPGLWQKLMEAGKDDGLLPIGLGARDTLRFEAALPLYGHEISGDISPLEAGLERFVKFEKADFSGRIALLEQKLKGVARRLAGFEMIDRGIPRNGYEIMNGEESIGFVTTGSYSPSLKKNIGMALVFSKYASEGTEFEVIIRNRALKAKVIKPPFYAKKYKK